MPGGVPSRLSWTAPAAYCESPIVDGAGDLAATWYPDFDTATTFVPIIVIMLLAVALNFLIGAIERRVAPWQAEIAGRDQQ